MINHQDSSKKINMKRIFLIVIVFSIQFITAQEQELQRAKRFFERTFYSEAIPLYERVIQVNSSIEVVKNLADCYYFTNDYEKALNYIQENKLAPSIVCGINGGHLDHILNNINIFMDTDHTLYAPPIVGFVMSEQQTKSFTLHTNAKLSILGIPQATISSQGLRWELNRYEISFPGNTSCFNQSVQDTIILICHKGKALILIYQ